MSNLFRKRLYREACRYTRWRPVYRFIRFHLVGPVTATTVGMRLTFGSGYVTSGGKVPEVYPRGPVTTEWAV